jgi:preprotein translocase subunit YajC
VSGGFVILILVMLLVMWMFMIRPQKRRQQAQQAMLDNIRIGDEVLTAGGFYGTVSSVQDDEVTVELAPGMDVRLAKRAIAVVMPPEGEESDEDVEEEALETEPEAEAPLEAEEQARR